MKILIFGSEGFIGHHCVDFFLQKGWSVFGCDLLDSPSLIYNYLKISRLQPTFEEVFADIQYDYCINAAGNGSVPVSIAHPLNDFEANCTDVIRILEYIRLKNRNCRYLHLSSAAVYGNSLQLPIKEDSPLVPLSPYGWHKLMAELLCKEYYTLYQLSIVVVRPFSVYGPGLRKQLVWDMYQKTKSGIPIELWGDGAETRDYIFINDMISAIDLILINGTNEFDIYNIASGEETNTNDIANIFYEFVGKVDYKFNHKLRPGDPRNWRADVTKLNKLGFNAAYNLNDGLKLTAEWLKKLN